MHRWLARFRIVVALLMGPLLVLAPMLPVSAQSERETQALDALFAQLRAAPDAAAARRLADEIWIYWTTPSDPGLAAMMRDVLMLRQQADFPAVLVLLDEITATYPQYAEGWNQRATIHYLLADYEQSLADIARVLELESRHFGALTGRAVIYKNQGEDALALRDMMAALAIHPFLAERALFPELKNIISI